MFVGLITVCSSGPFLLYSLCRYVAIDSTADHLDCLYIMVIINSTSLNSLVFLGVYFQDGLVLVCFFCFHDKHHGQKQLRGRKSLFQFTRPGHTPSLREVKVGTQAGTIEECCLLILTGSC